MELESQIIQILRERAKHLVETYAGTSSLIFDRQNASLEKVQPLILIANGSAPTRMVTTLMLATNNGTMEFKGISTRNEEFMLNFFYSTH